MCTKTECVAPDNTTNPTNPSTPTDPDTPDTPVTPVVPDKGDTDFDVDIDKEWGGSTDVEVGIG